MSANDWVPIFTGALGSTEIARKNWEHFAIGTAISGITCVCGENVCGIDPQLVLDKDGKVKSSPEMDRRIETYKRYHQGYGEILVQMNVEDTRFGVAEYVLNKHGLDTIEIKWGQGAKCIGGEIRVGDLARAQELKRRGYIVTPDPTLPDVVEAFKKGEIKEALALGAPNFKAVCMGRALMIPGMVGKDVEKLPLGAVGIYTASQKIRTGLQQLMAGSRNFNLSTITRSDLMSLTEECESVTGIPYVMRAYRKEAEKILAK